jgi:hypothetical protein
MDVFDKYTPPRWVGWFVAVIVVGIVVWSQFNIRVEVAQALRSRCEGAALQVRYDGQTGAFGTGTWAERSVFICLRNMKMYQISASNSAAPLVSEDTSWWPGLLVVLAVAWVGRKLWTMGRRSAS